eukprot:TRINITY_DN41249_c0_g1_i1.p1 TRINITY_DN41249_c0_g1~~TRINITY_DN41249_c0_g1_i1.p1  ORF type:complete len:248 (+),score=37.62 TRINITY_DN41249_c0_g1_i1:63-806(+)
MGACECSLQKASNLETCIDTHFKPSKPTVFASHAGDGLSNREAPHAASNTLGLKLPISKRDDPLSPEQRSVISRLNKNLDHNDWGQSGVFDPPRRDDRRAKAAKEERLKSLAISASQQAPVPSQTRKLPVLLNSEARVEKKSSLKSSEGAAVDSSPEASLAYSKDFGDCSPQENRPDRSPGFTPAVALWRKYDGGRSDSESLSPDFGFETGKRKLRRNEVAHTLLESRLQESRMKESRLHQGCRQRR